MPITTATAARRRSFRTAGEVSSVSGRAGEGSKQGPVRDSGPGVAVDGPVEGGGGRNLGRERAVRGDRGGRRERAARSWNLAIDRDRAAGGTVDAAGRIAGVDAQGDPDRGAGGR